MKYNQKVVPTMIYLFIFNLNFCLASVKELVYGPEEKPQH